MKRFSRHVSPGAATFLVVVVLVIVQWAWWHGLVYKPPPGPGSVSQPSRPGAARPDLVLIGHKDVIVDTLAGAIDPGDMDGPGYKARFDRPTGLVLDRAGVLYVCDTGNHRIRVVAPNGTVTTFAGSDRGFADGPAAQAKFNAPCGICISPDGAIYVADTGNGKVRRIRDGVVATIIQVKPTGSTSAAVSPLPVAIAYQDKPTPHLLVLDAASRSLNQYDLNGTYQSGSIQPETAIIHGGGADPMPTGSGNANVIQIIGADALPDVARRPRVRHLTGWCKIGSAELATDLGFSALFYVKDGVADVLAGIVPAERPVRSWRDGNGEVALFCDVTGVVTDGVKYAFVADTGNNCIRRVDIPQILFK